LGEGEGDKTPLGGPPHPRTAAPRRRRSLAPLARRSATPRGHDRRRRLLLSPRRVVSPRTPSRRTTPEPIVEPEPEFPNRSMQFLTRAFGPVENRQVISPVVESQLRRRHQFRIDELSPLGFPYLCCFSKSSPAGRLLFGIPLVIVFFMFAGREYIRLRDRRIHIYCRLMLSRDCSTYADLTGRGVKFYTTFSD